MSLEGIALGGEWGGSMLLSVEYATKGKRGLFGSVPQIGVYLGKVAGTLVWHERGRIEAAVLSVSKTSMYFSNCN